ncbi:hypothetical protein F2P56_035193 [Juglans regia]|uniref:Secreted RxLR effector protein 161-like n=1 Tax=Juglans regia TaxID=51240 RepID=A0A833TT29_JUGRE|nr:hypothetical protein F2P56_035193 [Juglans regia]
MTSPSPTWANCITSLGSRLFITPRVYSSHNINCINDLLHRTNMQNAKPVKTPMSTSEKLSVFSGQPFEDPTLYRSIVGSLQYLSLTRPDLTFALGKVCQFMNSPRVPHWQAVKQILRYLKHMTTVGLQLSPSSPAQLTAWSDADWAGCPDNRHSTSGYCIFLGSNLVSWSSKKQPIVARSSIEAEFKVVANATAEVIWLQHLCRDLGVHLKCPPLLYCDNMGAMYLSSNPVFHARTKHVEIDFHFVRNRVKKKSLRVAFISGKDQLADVLTKPLSSPQFASLYQVFIYSLCRST